MNCNSCGKEIVGDYYINSGNGAIVFCDGCVGDRNGALLNQDGSRLMSVYNVPLPDRILTPDLYY